MFDVSDALPAGMVSELEGGTSLLLTGPAMAGKQSLALDLLAEGLGGDDGLLIVSTGVSAAGCVDELERRVPELDPDRLGVVDCSGQRQRDAIREVTTQQVSSPGDLTGISIGTAKLMQQFSAREVSNIRHGLVSISTLLQYLDLDTIFKFLHIYTGRIDDTGGLGIFTLDNAAHDPQTINTITSEFDGLLELREGDGGREIRARGGIGAATGWQPL